MRPPGTDLPLVETLHRPCSAEALALAAAGERHLFWLDSSLHHPRLGRYSFIGAAPFLTVQSWGGRVQIRTEPAGPGTESRARCDEVTADPFRVYSELARQHLWPGGPAANPAPDPPFLGGAVGFFGYDLRHFVERLPARAPADPGLPASWFGFYDALIAIDHLTGTCRLIASGLPLAGDQGRRRALERMEWLRDIVARAGRLEASGPGDGGHPLPPAAPAEADPGPAGGLGTVGPEWSREGFLAAVRRVKAYIAAGDIFQANLAHRFSGPIHCSPLALYFQLRRTNPAPFGGFLDAGEFQVVSASPERFLQCSGDRIETRPIKGTRPRGATPAEDAGLRAELLASAKDRAEHVMIVDLERNDLGRFCRYGSVAVSEFVACEEHPTVFHLVSTVEGRLPPGADRIECIRACFPGGSITGAPKIRAMEIIDELEPVGRGVYTGAMGYLGLGGTIDLNIAIRTIVVKDGRASFHVGGGIVADSDPEAEYEETLVKAKGLLSALAGRRAVLR